MQRPCSLGLGLQGLPKTEAKAEELRKTHCLSVPPSLGGLQSIKCNKSFSLGEGQEYRQLPLL